MNTFEHFPAKDKCLLCGTNDDKPCILVEIDGTAKDGLAQAAPVHADCMLEKFRLNRTTGYKSFVYRMCD